MLMLLIMSGKALEQFGGDGQMAGAFYKLLASDDNIGGQRGASQLLDSLGIPASSTWTGRAATAR